MRYHSVLNLAKYNPDIPDFSKARIYLSLFGVYAIGERNCKLKPDILK